MSEYSYPLIGINADYLPGDKESAARAVLNAGYFDSVAAAGGLPVLVPPLCKKSELSDLLDRLDGFVLSGGLDLDPKRRQLPRHHAVTPMSARRQENDELLVCGIVDRRLPVLAIGVGLQQLNVHFGGSLYMHLPEDMPRAIPHFDRSGGLHRHAIVIKPQSRLEEIYGPGEFRVNSSHHQAVRQPGEIFRVAATAPDGVVEALECTDPDWFCIGVQWHPESDTASALDRQLFECFLQAAFRYRQPLTAAA